MSNNLKIKLLEQSNKYLKYIIVGFLVLVLATISIPEVISQKNSCHTDQLQFYLSSKAIESNINPYNKISFLNSQFKNDCKLGTHDYATPYSPGVLAAIYLLYKNYTFIEGRYFWAIGQLISIFIFLITATTNMSTRKEFISGFALIIILLFSDPIIFELKFANVSIYIALLSLLLLSSINKKNELVSGILLGLLLSIKLFSLPLLICFASLKKFKLLLVSTIVLFCSFLLPFIILGFDQSISLFLEWNPFLTAKTVIDSPYNISLFSIPYRLFGPDQSAQTSYYMYKPFFPNKILFNSAQGIIYLFYFATLFQIIRSKTIITKVELSLFISLLFNLICWHHYIIILFPIIWKLKNSIIHYRKPSTAILYILSIFMITLFYSAQLYVESSTAINHSLTVLPLLGMICLYVIYNKLESEKFINDNIANNDQ